jgi:hypothetical protein
MTLTMRPRRTKFIAKLMAFVWLFGFAVALANACAVHHASAAASSAQHPGCAHAAPVDDVDDADACQPACKGLCKSGQNAVAKTKSVDVSSAAQLVAMPGTSCIHPATAAAQPWCAIATLPPPSPPVAILFLRLTI